MAKLSLEAGGLIIRRCAVWDSTCYISEFSCAMALPYPFHERPHLRAFGRFAPIGRDRAFPLVSALYRASPNARWAESVIIIQTSNFS
jgi:hypothetical protein